MRRATPYTSYIIPQPEGLILMSVVESEMTPAGLQKRQQIAGRRRIVAIINISIYLVLLAWLSSIFQRGNWGLIDALILIAFAIAAPWSVIGVCNAAIGFWLLHFHRRGLEAAAPFLGVYNEQMPITTRTALLMTIRNEDPQRAFARLRTMKASVDATGEGAHFDWFVLSDTTNPAIADREDKIFALWRAQSDEARLFYRRRANNIGYKAGNIRDFCERWGSSYEFMIPLDADSLMDGETILRLVRIGEAYPQIGILQSLVVGTPSQSAFARIFQFGMRHGMRTYTLGASWWAADCGSYWGHNALVRVSPFFQHCELPKLGGDQHILSHDQIEAALMRRAGYEVRVLPIECGSYEDNPPDLPEFLHRELRWCQGNMQYLKLLGIPGLLPTSRFQLFWAVSMFIGAPAWTLIIALVFLKAAVSENLSNFPAASSMLLYATFLALYMAPKLAGFVDVALTSKALTDYGGAARFLASSIVEICSSLIIGSTTTLGVSLLQFEMIFGHSLGWGEQTRDARSLTWRAAVRAFRPQLAFGALVFALGAVFAPQLLLWSLPLTLGYPASVPFAVFTASPRVGAWLARAGYCAIPEEQYEFEIFAILRRLRDG
jgi:membrane glycosyltransferase